MNLNAISPLEGRYHAAVSALSDYVSEFALMRYRVMVEVEYLQALLAACYGSTLASHFDLERFEELRAIYAGFGPADAQEIKRHERTTNHDLKAVEYFLKDKLRAMGGFESAIELVHFGLTSEDTNNLAYSCMLRDAMADVMLPALGDVLERLVALARASRATPMLARTHGQPASPTTMGKELGVFLSRLEGEIAPLREFRLYGKLNGATGTFSALAFAMPHVDWLGFAATFVESLDLVPNLITTQIEPHDRMAGLFDALRRINVILLDLDADLWRYVSDGYLRQAAVEGEVGSSTMPHKINPIDFENSEGNLGLANALLGFMSQKLPQSRLQRDLSDSTVLRNIGVALAHALLGYRSLCKGLSRVEADAERMAFELEAHPEVIAEAIQTVLRAEGHPAPYEALKDATRGQALGRDEIDALLRRLEMSCESRHRLLELTPSRYLGYAERLADLAIEASERLIAELRGAASGTMEK